MITPRLSALESARRDRKILHLLDLAISVPLFEIQSLRGAQFSESSPELGIKL